MTSRHSPSAEPLRPLPLRVGLFLIGLGAAVILLGVLPAVVMIVIAAGEPRPTQTASEPWPAGWVRYAPEEADYEVALPAIPERDPWRAGVCVRRNPDGPTFGVYQPAGAADEEQALAQFVIAFDAPAVGHGELVKTEDGTAGKEIEGRPARGGLLRARLFLRPRGPCFFYAYTASGDQADPVAEQRFFRSIRLTESVAP